MGKLGGWLAGIVAAIIATYAGWYFTRPPSTTTFEGMAYSESAPVPKAMVSITITGTSVNSGPIHNVTDENGAYRFDFTGLPETAGATLSVVASGFHNPAPTSLSKPLGSDIHQDFSLIPLTEAPIPDAGARPRPPAANRIPRYVRKAPEQATKFQIQAQH
jgi:hypothetical protein